MNTPRTAPDDPNRCKGTAKYGQCSNAAEHGSEYCKHCGGVSTKNEEEKRAYLVTKSDVKRRLAELDAGQDPVRDLQRTISVVHMLIETWIRSATSDTAIMAACGPLEKLIQRMESLCKSAVTLQEKLDLLLPRSAVLNVGQTIVKIVIEELQGVENYEQIVDRIINRIFPAINNTPKLLEPPKHV